jgi:hypothetical protein
VAVALAARRVLGPRATTGVPAARLARLLVLVVVVRAAQVAQAVLAERALTLVSQPVVMAAAEQMAAAALGRPGLPPLAVTVARQFLPVTRLASQEAPVEHQPRSLGALGPKGQAVAAPEVRVTTATPSMVVRAAQAQNGMLRTALEGAAVAGGTALLAVQEEATAVPVLSMVAVVARPGIQMHPPPVPVVRASSSLPTRPRPRRPSFRMHPIRPSFWRAEQPET